MAETQPIENSAPEGGLSHVSKEDMTPYEIIKEDIKRFNLDLDPDQTYAKMLEMVKQPQYRAIRANDSLIFIENHMNGTADGMMFTADKPKTFVNSLRIFNNAFKRAGVNQVAFAASGMAIEPLLKKAKLRFDSEEIEGGKKVTVYAT